jgi:hypothetical protein
VTEPNTLYYGDNLDILRLHVKDESVDLVYLDPPFNSNADYNVLFQEKGIGAAAEIKAFEDTWQWNIESAAAYQEVVEAGGRVADTLKAFRTMLGTSDMLAYLAMMAPRLVELRRVLKPTGSLYLHCDPTASHYLKLLLDAVLGPENFRSGVPAPTALQRGLDLSTRPSSTTEMESTPPTTRRRPLTPSAMSTNSSAIRIAAADTAPLSSRVRAFGMVIAVCRGATTTPRPWVGIGSLRATFTRSTKR